MATNPRFPGDRPTPTLAAQKKKKSASPWVPIGILAAAVLLIAIFYYLPHTPTRANMSPSNAAVPVQPTSGQIQLTNVRLSDAPVGGQMYIYANMMNSGNTAINGVRARVIFHGQNDQPLQAVYGVVEAVQNGVGVNLVDAPIKPGTTEPVRIPVTQVPQGWNHHLPSIEVADVTAVGAR